MTPYYHRRMARRLSDAERDARIERVVRWAVGAVIAGLIIAGYVLVIEAGVAMARGGM